MSDEVNAGHLRAFIERVERLNEEKAALAEDISGVYAEAKANGFDTKIIRKIVALRKLDPEKRAEEEAITDVYLRALGMLADTPLGQAATERAIAAEREAGQARAPRKKGLKAAVGDMVVTTLRKGLGEPVALTDDEKRKGASAAFKKPDGTRVSVAFDARV